MVDKDETVVEKQHAWDSPPVVRGVATLLGVAAAGFLVWLATGFDLEATGEYWAAMGILAGAGIKLGRDQFKRVMEGIAGKPCVLFPGAHMQHRMAERMSSRRDDAEAGHDFVPGTN